MRAPGDLIQRARTVNTYHSGCQTAACDNPKLNENGFGDHRLETHMPGRRVGRDGNSADCQRKCMLATPLLQLTEGKGFVILDKIPKQISWRM
eukprot:3863149-Pyramimonas_sp.AAC.1